MKLKRFLVISLLLFIAFSVVADDCEDVKVLLGKMMLALDESTILLEEAKTESLATHEKYKHLDILVDELTIENEQLRDITGRMIEELEESNNVLEVAKAQIFDDQLEIADLRTQLEKSIVLIEELSSKDRFKVGASVSYPLGIKALGMFKIPRVPIALFIDMGIIINTKAYTLLEIITPIISVGAVYSF